MYHNAPQPTHERIAPLYQKVAAVKAAYPLMGQSYFQALEAGTMTREDFVATQIQFLQAVVFFSRPMALLAARMPRPEQRWPILHNVMEEHGEGDYHQSHEYTFLSLLERLGVSREDIQGSTLWPEVKAFNLALIGACSFDDIWLGAATLGMIEDMFAAISAFLGDTVVRHEWLAADELIHYATHATLDIAHAADFYRILEAPYQRGGVEAYAIEQGLHLGATIFMQMYRGLHEARQRRSSRQWTGAHSAQDGWTMPPET